jgi:hypothetical protein
VSLCLSNSRPGPKSPAFRTIGWHRVLRNVSGSLNGGGEGVDDAALLTGADVMQAPQRHAGPATHRGVEANKIHDEGARGWGEVWIEKEGVGSIGSPQQIQSTSKSRLLQTASRFLLF